MILFGNENNIFIKKYYVTVLLIKYIIFEFSYLLMIENDPLCQRLEDVGEVDQEAQDGTANAQYSSAQDQMHGQVMAAALT